VISRLQQIVRRFEDSAILNICIKLFAGVAIIVCGAAIVAWLPVVILVPLYFREPSLELALVLGWGGVGLWGVVKGLKVAREPTIKSLALLWSIMVGTGFLYVMWLK
jgi:hypothetical protein